MGKVYDYRELSDADFIRSLDELSRPYYYDYLGKTAHPKMCSTDFGCEKKECKVYIKEKKKPEYFSLNDYYVRRNICLILPLILSFLHSLLATIVLFPEGEFSPYFALLTGEMNVYYATVILNFLAGPTLVDTLTFCLSIVTILLVIMPLVTMILSVFALSKPGGKHGEYKPIRIFYAFLVTALLSVASLILCIFSANKYGFCVSYGAYIQVIFPIFSIILSVFAYKKETRFFLKEGQ